VGDDDLCHVIHGDCQVVGLHPKIRNASADVHQGNGTAAIFDGDDRVTTFDCFCDSNYPWHTRRRSTIDVPLADDISDEEYLHLLAKWMPRLADRHPQLIIFQAGVDALQEDSLGNMRLSRRGLNARNNMVYSLALGGGVPLVVCMGGGYAKPDMSPSVVAHADVYRTAALRLHAFL
jgi:acetoin utilization deacetylase AcuC-like enzyme